MRWWTKVGNELGSTLAIANWSHLTRDTCSISYQIWVLNIDTITGLAKATSWIESNLIWVFYSLFAIIGTFWKRKSIFNILYKLSRNKTTRNKSNLNSQGGKKEKHQVECLPTILPQWPVDPWKLPSRVSYISLHI